MHSAISEKLIEVSQEHFIFLDTFQNGFFLSFLSVLSNFKKNPDNFSMFF